MRRKAWFLFTATSIIWGSSFLFIRLAVQHMPPSVVVFGRAVLGAAFLLPLAIRARAFRGLRPLVLPIVAVALLDMALPTFLTAWGEQHVSSSVAGILTATDPLFTAVLALWLIRSEAVNRTQFTGLIIGLGGVAALLGLDFGGRAAELAGAGAVLLSALGYAAAALLYRRWLADVPALAVTALMTVISSVLFAGPALAGLPRHLPPAGSLLALAALGMAGTGLAYWLFYLLIDQAGAATAAVITYLMPVVALVLGVGLAGEKLTIGALIGLMLIAAGAWLATGHQPPGPHRRRRHRQPPRPAAGHPGREQPTANRADDQAGITSAEPATRHEGQTRPAGHLWARPPTVAERDPLAMADRPGDRANPPFKVGRQVAEVFGRRAQNRWL